MTLNVKAAKLSANSDLYTITELVSPTILNVLSNDQLGVTPTTIDSIQTTGFTLGTITIELDNKLKFTPNGSLGTSTFNYTIEDNVARQSTTVVTIITIEE